MGYNKLFLQKLGFASFLTIVNVLLVSLCYSFTKKWYIVQLPLLFIFAFQMISIVLIILLSVFKKDRRLGKQYIRPLNICYFIPCYNESEQQITSTMNSFINQTEIESHGKVYVVVCDGRKQGAGNALSTDKILSQVVFPGSKSIILQKGYTNDKQEINQVQVLLGETSNKCPYFVVIKKKNCGKRDSIGIIRRLCYNFNRNDQSYSILSKQLMLTFQNHLFKYGIESIEHIVGVDADTVFQPDCTIQLLREIQRKSNILASTGMVKVQFTGQTCIGKLMECYQHVQYIAGQGFMRNQQNLTQQKINCLPGCLNITRVTNQTCGEQLLSIYMKAPAQNDHIFQWIRGTASQDRHSVMLLLKLYGQCHTTCTWDAQAVTSVPVTPSVFLSQRKRWSLGSATHGFWMIFMENIPFFERLSSLIFVLTYILTPFFMYSLVTWLNTIASGNGDSTFWIMTGLVQLITLYKLSIVLWLRMSITQKFVYVCSYGLYYVAGPIVGICVWAYSLYHMDDFGWGKTRTVIETKQQKLQQTTTQGQQFKSVSSTLQSINYLTHNNHPMRKTQQIVYQMDQQHDCSSNPTPIKYNKIVKPISFTHSHAFNITLSGQNPESSHHDYVGPSPFIQPQLNKPFRKRISSYRQTNQTIQTDYIPQTTTDNQMNRESNLIVFMQSDSINQTQQDENNNNNIQNTTAAVTQRAKIINFQQ